MKIMVSACLLGRKCKYNGGDNRSEALAAALEGHEVVPVCPEVAGGLGVPRRPCEIVNGVVMNDAGENIDAAFRAGAAACLQTAADERIDLAVLQPRSPSCGVKQVYDGSFSGRLTEGSGVFAELLKENGFRVVEPGDVPDGAALQRACATQTKALVVIDMQNDITKHYRDIIGGVNAAIDRAQAEGMHIVYIKHHNLSAGTRTFKPDSHGEALVPELKVASDHVFVKTKSNALTSGEFSAFIEANGIREFYVAGADATACVKSTCFNMAKAGFTVHVISDCVTSYDLKKLPEMLAYYESKGCAVAPLAETFG